MTDEERERVQRVMRNPIAHRVKIADAMDNATDDARPGMRKRYEWVLEKLGAAEATTLPVVGEEGA